MVFRFHPRVRQACATAGVALLMFGWIGSVLQASAASLERVAVKDSYVLSSRSSTNYGLEKSLRTKESSPIAVSYLGFDMTGVNFPVGRATLKFLSKTSAPAGVQVRNALGSWSERAITFANAPSRGPIQSESGPFSSGQWVSVDVTSAVNTTGASNLALTTASGSYVDISSRETIKEAPRLIVEEGSSTTTKSYFVDSLNGLDSNTGTSPEAPWQTLDKIRTASMAPGDSMLLRRGATWTGTLTIPQSGNSTAPILVGAYGTGPLPVIQGGGSCVILEGSYISLSDVESRDCSWAGVELKGSSNRVQKSTMTLSAAGVVVDSGATKNVISANQIKDNQRMSVLTVSPSNDDSGAFGILINGDDNEVALNTISGSDAFSYDYGRDGAAIEIYGGQRNHIHHNRASENNTFAELGGARTADNVFAYNAVMSNLTASLFLVTRGADDAFGPVSRTSLYNNSVDLSGSQSQGVVCYAGCGPDILKMRNNIVRAVSKVGYADRPFDEDYGLYSGGVIQFTPGGNSLVADPGWIDETAGDLHLKSTSPAVDTAVLQGYGADLDGITVPLDGNGDGIVAPDRGAFELAR